MVSATLSPLKLTRWRGWTKPQIIVLVSFIRCSVDAVGKMKEKKIECMYNYGVRAFSSFRTKEITLNDFLFSSISWLLWTMYGNRNYKYFFLILFGLDRLIQHWRKKNHRQTTNHIENRRWNHTYAFNLDG